MAKHELDFIRKFGHLSHGFHNGRRLATKGALKIVKFYDDDGCRIGTKGRPINAGDILFLESGRRFSARPKGIHIHLAPPDAAGQIRHGQTSCHEQRPAGNNDDPDCPLARGKHWYRNIAPPLYHPEPCGHKWQEYRTVHSAQCKESVGVNRDIGCPPDIGCPAGCRNPKI